VVPSRFHLRLPFKGSGKSLTKKHDQCSLKDTTLATVVYGLEIGKEASMLLPSAVG
jgi:hypothetical protein